MLHLLLFVGLYLALAMGSLILNPAFSFTLYEIVYFMNPTSRWWSGPLPSISYSFIVVALMMLVLVKNFKEHKLNNPLKIPQMRWMYILLLLYFIAGFYAMLPDGHSKALESYIKLQITMTIAFMLVTNIEKLKYYTYGYIFSAWYLSFYIFQQGRTSGDRVEGIGTVDSPDSNGIAAAIAPSIVLALFYLWRSKNNLVKMAFAIAFVFGANAIVLINSRGAFLGVAVSIMYFFCYLYFAKVRTPNQRLFAVAITFIGIIGFFKVADQSFLARISSITAESRASEEKESGGTRMVFWGAAWDMTKDYPFGNGFKGFDRNAPQYLPQYINTGKSRYRSVHSTWFETLTEVGYPGLLAFLLMIYCAFKTTRQCKKHLKAIGDTDNYYKVVAIEAALISFLVAMTFLNRMRAEILYWLILYTACLHNLYLVQNTTKRDTKT